MIDLHVHTTCSDGRLTVKELLEKAIIQGLTTISFCDHNVVKAYEILENNNYYGYKDKIKFITGIEFDFVYKHKDFHLLGYDFDWKKMNESKYINKKTDYEIIEEERKKLIYLKKVCREQNIKISEDLDIQEKNNKASTVLKYDMIKYKENNKILDDMLGKNREKSFARGYVGNPNTPFYIDNTIGLPKFEEVSDVIHSCGGKVFLAHPFDYKDIDSKKFINDIYKTGNLDGIEAMHNRHSKEQVQYIKNFCKERKLMISGGSDFHRLEKQKMGFGVDRKVEITEEFNLKYI